jgi:hypothetical protein
MLGELDAAGVGHEFTAGVHFPPVRAGEEERDRPRIGGRIWQE